MAYHRKVEIEDIGTFSVPLPIWKLLRDESARANTAEAAEASLRKEWKEYTQAKAQEFADMQLELNRARIEITSV